MSNATRPEGGADAEATPETRHDSAKRRRSLSGVIAIQSQNAFNDNLVRFVLISLALVVARGTPVGDNIEFILSILLPIRPGPVAAGHLQLDSSNVQLGVADKS